MDLLIGFIAGTTILAWMQVMSRSAGKDAAKRGRKAILRSLSTWSKASFKDLDGVVKPRSYHPSTLELLQQLWGMGLVESDGNPSPPQRQYRLTDLGRRTVELLDLPFFKENA